MSSDVKPRLSVRAPQLGDVRMLSSAEALCFADPWPPQFFVSEILSDGRFNRLLVDPGGSLVAYLFCAWQFLDLHVLKVATLPPYRRQGLSTRLMRLAEEHTLETGGESLTLEVRTSNTEAISMYASLDYSLAGVRKAYYQDGEDAVIMTKRMRDPVW
jgi:ribosomal-protein-alanine N-acetyltransferase